MVQIAIKIMSLCLLTALFLGGCAEPSVEPICTDDDNRVRPCTLKELAVINDMKYIIFAVRNYESSNPDMASWQLRKKTKYGPIRLLMSGESHPNIIGRIQTLGLINASLKRGDVMLLEGGDRREEHFDNCGIIFIYNIFEQWQFEKLGRSYTEKFKWEKKTEYKKLFLSTFNSYDLTGLSIAHMKCGYWDDQDAVLKSIENNLAKVDEYLPVRNRSMTEAIKEGLTRYNRVFLNAGYAHLPLGEALMFMRDNSKHFKAKKVHRLSEIYRIIDEQKAMPAGARTFTGINDSSGSTKIIDEFLKRERIPYVQAIHGKMFF